MTATTKRTKKTPMKTAPAADSQVAVAKSPVQPATGTAEVLSEKPLEVTGDGSGKALPPITFRISSKREKGFYRAGRHWPRDGVDVRQDEFTEEQWAALDGEPMLTIEVL